MSIHAFFRKLILRFRYRKYGLSFPLYCKAHGVKTPDHQGALAQSRAGDELQLVHVPADGYPFNIYVYNIGLNRILGYLDARLAEKLVRTFGAGFCLDGEITSVTGGPPEYKYFGCNLRIFDTKTMMLPYLDG